MACQIYSEAFSSAVKILQKVNFYSEMYIKLRNLNHQIGSLLKKARLILNDRVENGFFLFCLSGERMCWTGPVYLGERWRENASLSS